MADNIFELGKEIFTLTGNVNTLQSDVDKLQKLMTDVRDRLVKLESQGELIEERAKNASMSHVANRLDAMSGEFYKGMAKVDQEVKALEDRVSNTIGALPPPSKK